MLFSSIKLIVRREFFHHSEMYVHVRTYTPTESAVYSVYLSVYILSKPIVCQNGLRQNAGAKPVAPKRRHQNVLIRYYQWGKMPRTWAFCTAYGAKCPV